MLSIVICSVSSERLRQVTQNICDTIGIEHEVIAIDNCEKHWPIARAYNEGAHQACYPYLFFVHEDVKFHSQGWGAFIIDKLKEPDCGVIGFAGSKVKLNCYSGWLQHDSWACSFLYQGGGESTTFSVKNATLEHPFEEVVVLDGLGLFVRKDLWQAYPFDEEVLTGFHCYDMDFSLQIAASKQYKNYVCCSLKVLIEHFSLGQYNRSWYQDTIRIHKQKWSKILPMVVNGFELSKRREQKMEERYFDYFVCDLLLTDYPEKKIALKDFLAYPFSRKHLKHCISNVYKYLVFR